MNSFKRLLSSTITLVLSFLRSTTNYIADGISERNMKKVALNLVLLLSVATLVILTAALFVKLAFQNLHILIAAAFLAAAAYSVVSKLFQTEEPTPPRKPTAEDYQAVLATVKPSLATVAPALGLAPIYEHSDIRADPEEQILPWGKVWRMKFKLLNRTPPAPSTRISAEASSRPKSRACWAGKILLGSPMSVSSVAVHSFPSSRLMKFSPVMPLCICSSPLPARNISNRRPIGKIARMFFPSRSIPMTRIFDDGNSWYSPP